MRLLTRMGLRKLYLVLVTSILPTLFACSVEKAVIKGAVDYITETRQVFERESDLEIAKIALASNLKILETLSEKDPGNYKLNLFLSETFSVYSLAFVEDEMEEWESTDLERAEYHKERAVRLYRRAAQYAYRILEEKLGKAEKLESLSKAELSKKIKTLENKEMPALFWYAYARASQMNLQKDDLNALIAMPMVVTMMEALLNWNESFYFAGPHVFFGIYYGSRPKIMGGNQELSKKSFEKALKVTESRILLIPYFLAKTYCVQTQNYSCFQKYLNYVKQTPADIHPDQVLANEVAKKKARRLFQKREDLFFDIPVDDGTLN